MGDYQSRVCIRINSVHRLFYNFRMTTILNTPSVIAILRDGEFQCQTTMIVHRKGRGPLSKAQIVVSIRLLDCIGVAV